MKRLVIGILLIVCIQLFLVGAYDLEVESFSESEVVLALTNLESVDVKVTDVKATVESETLSDTYVVDAALTNEEGTILVSIDVSPLFEDYTKEQIQAITVSGLIEINGEQTEFGKRVPLRNASPSTARFAPAQENSTLIYWIVALCVILVILILLIFYKKPKTRKSSQKKRTKRKSPVKKKGAKKKAKKRL
ncbi:MAG: hypothetical protein QT08_C0014G0037 [archaeon GW2011_AR17]|nr:MAG: hypothetical protein QT08_C0014G0037 [archaeon GW2011_AR17]MBS3154795.1 hypothetical protein [Candidatus Woesearchaeota archaeon]HIH15774.1 hypothetical protein [Nanoarchaeota archaeon]HIH58969.1 hypothetical protein [Nanoarchaeota archaeon]HII14346.1 hypothetical protein [Nanoarchaeota archaeon]